MLWRYSLRWGLPHKPRPGPYACPNPARLTAPRRRGCRADPQRIRSCAVRAMRFQFDPYNEVEVMAMVRKISQYAKAAQPARQPSNQPANQPANQQACG